MKSTEDSPRPPTKIMIIRHAEKPSGGDDAPAGVTIDGSPSSHSLTARGWQRAGALIALFGGQISRPELAVPERLFCAHYDSPVAHRVYETLLPLSLRLNLEIQPVGATNDPGSVVAAALRSGPEPALICWDHENIPALASLLPAEPAGSIPSEWPDDRFDLVWVFTIGDDGAYQFGQAAQNLLDGDPPA